MIKLIKCEYMKTKRKHIFLTTFALLVLMGMWAFYGTSSKDMSDFIRQNGYTMFLYQFPLVNAIFFPLLCTVILNIRAVISNCYVLWRIKEKSLM